MQLFGTGKAYVLMCLMIVFLQPFWMLVSGLVSRKAKQTEKSILSGSFIESVEVHPPKETEAERQTGAPEGWLEDGSGGSIFNRAVFSILTALAIAALFQLYPGNRLLPDVDPSVFLYIGKRMAAGNLPYRDLFDHKGPLLYLIQYAGALLSKSGSGVWLLEVLNLSFTIYIQLAVCRLIANRHAADWISVLLIFGMCGWNVYQGGNFAEEYALPWISLGLFVFLRFFKTGEVRLEQIVLLGLSFGAVFLLRVNMAAIWLALTPVVIIMLLKEKRAGGIFPCVLAFLAGSAVILLPVFLWLSVKGILKDFWECYFLFNFRYTDEAAPVARDYAALSLEMLRMVWPGVLTLAGGLLLCNPRRAENGEENQAEQKARRRTMYAVLFTFLVSLFCAQMSGRAYSHYAMILLPLLTVPAAVCLEKTGKLWTRLIPGRAGQDLWIAPVLSSLVILAGGLWYAGTVPPEEPEKNPMAQYLLQNTREGDDVLILGNSCWLYLTTGRYTENRFFYQTPPVQVSEEMKHAFLAELRGKTPDLVMAPGYDISGADGWLADVYQILIENGLSYHFDDGFGVFEHTATQGGNNGPGGA